MDNLIRQALNSNLSAVHVSQRNVNQIMNNIMGGKKVKKKLSVAFVLIILVIMTVATALAVMTLNAFTTHQDGVQTSGITFTADNVYFDRVFADSTHYDDTQ